MIYHGIKRALSPLPVPVSTLERLYAEQVAVLAYLVVFMSVVGGNTALLLGADLRFTGNHSPPYILLSSILACYGVLLLKMRVFLGSHGEKPNRTRSIQEVVRWFFVLGLIWGVVFIKIMHMADAAQRSLLYAIIVACMSTAAVVGPVSVAFAFWVPIFVGGVVSLFVAPGGTDPFAVICLIAYAVLTAFCIIYLNKKLTERSLNAIRLEEQNEVVKLLLRDFEESASDWLWETNAEMELQRVSPRLAEVARKSPDELQGKFPQVLLGDPRNDQRAASPMGKLTRLLNQRSAFRDLVHPGRPSGGRNEAGR